MPLKLPRDQSNPEYSASTGAPRLLVTEEIYFVLTMRQTG